MGVSEIACLIDFGVESDLALKGLQSLNSLRARFDGVTPAEVEVELPSVPELMQRHFVTHMQCTPSLARLLVATPEAQAGLGKLKVMLVGGEALPPGLASELRASLQGELHNMYGPTETTVWSTSQRLDAHTETVPIGTAFANTMLYVVDEFGRLVRDGGEGELWIGGDGVARGYHNRPELTASRFLPDPFLGRDGARVYRTGDLVRKNAAGELEYLGRLDDQVKILGHRIELGEIEASLELHPEVKQCAVVAIGDAESGYVLQAYLVATAACPDPGALRDFLQARLPQAMIPSRFLRVAALPLNSNGKIDRKSLKSLFSQEPSPTAAAKRPLAAADSDLEQRIADVWREVLGVHDIGVLDNFFDIGGHSLMAVRVHSRLKKELSPGLSITDLFRYSTVRALAAHVSGGNGDDTPSSLATSARNRAAARREALKGRRPKAR
jgi:acyl-CoA synthetase (AMP-forming)/AMP-acid ligase II/acyl carrier protein